LLVILSLCCGAVAHAQGPVLHEYVPDVEEDEAMMLLAPGESEPAGIVYDGEVIPAPDDGTDDRFEVPDGDEQDHPEEERADERAEM